MAQLIDLRIAPNGRVVLPKVAREALGVTGAGLVALSVEGEVVTLTSMASNVRRAQALYQAHVLQDQTSDAFLESRRLEAAKDRD